MLSVLSYYSLVNRENLEKKELQELDFAYFSERLYQEVQFKDKFSLVRSKKGYVYHALIGKNAEEIQCGCSFGMPARYAKCPKKRGESARHRKPKNILYPELFENVYNINVMKSTLKITLIKFDHRQAIFVCDRHGEKVVFEGRAKGTAQYNKDMEMRIVRVAGELQKTHKHVYFFTVTIDKQNYSFAFDRIWQEFSQKLGILCKNLSRELNGKIITAVEAHSNGMPHAHLMIFTNREFTDTKYHYNRKKKSVYIYKGTLHNIVTRLWTEGFSDLQKVKADKVKWYLAKYAAKNTRFNIKQLIRKKEWTKDDFKQVMTMLFPMLFCVRQFRFPKLSKLQKESIETRRPIMSCAPKEFASVDVRPPHFNAAELSASRSRLYLTTLCTKSPLPCLRHLYITQKFDAEMCLFDKDGGFDDISEEEKVAIQAKGHCISCGGCFLSTYIEQILYKEDKMFQKNYFNDIFALEMKQNFNKFFVKNPKRGEEAMFVRNAEEMRRFAYTIMPWTWSYEEMDFVLNIMLSVKPEMWVACVESKFHDWIQARSKMIGHFTWKVCRNKYEAEAFCYLYTNRKTKFS